MPIGNSCIHRLQNKLLLWCTSSFLFFFFLLSHDQKLKGVKTKVEKVRVRTMLKHMICIIDILSEYTGCHSYLISSSHRPFFLLSLWLPPTPNMMEMECRISDSMYNCHMELPTWPSFSGYWSEREREKMQNAIPWIFAVLGTLMWCRDWIQNLSHTSKVGHIQLNHYPSARLIALCQHLKWQTSF